MKNNPHHGQNIRLFRELRGLKQEALAATLGDTWSQKRVSILESKESIATELLTCIASALDIPASALATFRSENFFATLLRTHEEPEGVTKLSLVESLCQVHREKIELYERIAREKDCIIELLDRHLKISSIEDRVLH